MKEKIFVKKLENMFRKEGFSTDREVGVGYGVADLVLVRLNTSKCAVRRKNNQFKRLDKEEYFKILDCLPETGGKKPASLEFLIEKTHLSKSFLKYRVLKKLKRWGYVKEVKKNFYFKIDGWIPIAKEIIAIEAKLKNWKKGITQANRYKSFADKVYLAVPFKISHLVDKNRLEKFNIGLITLDIQRGQKKISWVKRENPLNYHMYNLAAESVLSRKVLLHY